MGPSTPFSGPAATGPRPRRPAPRGILLAGLIILLALPVRVSAQGVREVDRYPGSDGFAVPRKELLDSLTALWSDDGFNSLVDGQPNSPGSGEVEVGVGWLDERVGERSIMIMFTPAYTPDLGDFFRNTEFSLEVPMVWGRRGLYLDDIGLAWEQRWLAHLSTGTMLATSLQLELPSSRESTRARAILTGIGARAFGRNVVFLNAFAATSNGDDAAAWGLLSAYKRQINPRLYLVADHLYMSERGEGSSNLLELSGVYSAGKHFEIGPGLVLGLGDNETTPRWGVGVALTFTF